MCELPDHPRDRLEPEWMDAPDADPTLLRKSLAYLRRVNRLLGYTRATVAHLRRFSRAWKPGETIGILDIATGSADIPRAILHWSRKQDFDVRIVAIDLHHRTLLEASLEPEDRLALVRTDALRLPFPDGAFDYATTNLFLHHLTDQQIVTALKEMSRVARRGIIASDILRTRRAYAWIRLLTLMSNPMVRHDGPLSVAQALTKRQAMALRDRAGLDFLNYYRHFAHRFVLAGEKSAGNCHAGLSNGRKQAKTDSRRA